MCYCVRRVFLALCDFTHIPLWIFYWHWGHRMMCQRSNTDENEWLYHINWPRADHDDLIKCQKTSVLLVICAGNSPVTGEFPSQRAVAWSFDVFFELCLNKRLSKQSWGWWFETPAHPLWRYDNILYEIRLQPNGVNILWDIIHVLPFSISSELLLILNNPCEINLFHKHILF